MQHGRPEPPPPLPPRPPSTAVLAPPSLPPRIHVDQPPWHAPPPDFHAQAYTPEKYAPQPQPTTPRYSRKAKLVAIGVGVLLLVVVVASLCGALVNKGDNKGSTSSSSDHHGGHPLSIADGGPDIGQPGSIPKFGKHSTDHFVMTTERSTFVTRLDPIVSPGSASAHLHRVHGASYFTPNLLKASELQRLANCSTTLAQDDKSQYWCPTIHHRFLNGSMISLPLIRTSLYYFPKAPTGVPLYPFPDNFNLVVGDPNRRVYNESAWYAPGMFYQCYRGGGQDLVTSDFPDSACRDGLVLIVTFPSCWDGVYAENADYTKHVAVPLDGINGYFCPPQFPKKFITLRFETTFATNQYPYQGKGKTWVLANGDTTGLGIHGDFVNGWKESTMQSVLDNCRYMNATQEVPVPEDPRNCPALNASINFDVMKSCRGQTPIVNESVGETNPIPYLPGCNSIWSGTGPKPDCPPGRQAGGGGQLSLVNPKVWLNNEGYVD